MTRAVVAVGSNIHPHAFILAAIEAIRQRFGLVAISRFVQTDPIDRPEQSKYLNGALLIETDLDSQELQDHLGQIETCLGRVRTADRYAPRTIDLDLVVYDGQIVDDDVLTRDFLARSVAELLEGDLT